MGYPKLPVTMLDGESVFLDLPTFVHHASLQLCCATNNYATLYITPDGLVLVNTFEDTFGDVWGEGVWRELGKNASDISRIVVALASFNGNFTPMWHLPVYICICLLPVNNQNHGNGR